MFKRTVEQPGRELSQFGLFGFPVAQVVLNSVEVIRARLRPCSIFDQERLTANLLSHILYDGWRNTGQLLGHEAHKAQDAELHHEAQTVMGGARKGKLLSVGLRQRKEGNEVIVGDLCGECIELGALGLGKNLNRHSTSVWRETLVLLHG